MTYDVVLTESARQKILEQATYIAREQQEPETAARWLQQVMEAGDSLETMPERCERAEEDFYFPYDVRARRVGRFMLLYTVVEETKTVWIVNARHGRQLPRPQELPRTLDDIEGSQ